MSKPPLKHSSQRLLEERSWLRALSASLVGVHEADDLAQETLLVALTQQGGSSALPGRGWLAGIARRLAMARVRRRAQRTSIEDSHAREESRDGRWTTRLDAAELAEKAELEHEIVGRLLDLREPYRETLLLRFQGGISAAEIARRTGVPAGTVRRRIKVGLDSLRSQMNAAHPELGAWAPLLVGVSKAKLSTLASSGLGVPAQGTTWLLNVPGVLMMKEVLVAIVLMAGLGGWWWLEHREPGTQLETESAVVQEGGSSLAGAPTDEETRAAGIAPIAKPGREPRPGNPPGTSAPANHLGYRIVDAAGDAVSVNKGTLLVGSTMVELDPAGPGRLTLNAEPFSAAVREARLAVSREGAWPCVFDVPATAGTHTLVWPAGNAMAGQLRLDGAAPGEPIELTLVRDIGWSEAPAVEGFDSRTDSFPRNVTTDHRGLFTLRDLPEDWRGWLTLGPDWIFAHATRRSDTFSSVAGGQLLLEVGRAPYLTGQLVCEDEGAELGGITFTVMEAQEAVSTNYYSTETDAEGRFRWPWRNLGARITLQPGSAPTLMTQEIAGLAMPADGVLDLGQIQVQAAPRQSLLVTDPEGNPIPSARVREEALGPLLWVETTEAGEATLGLKNRNTKLVLEAAGYATTRVDFAWSPRIAVIELQPELRAALTVIGPDGKGRAGVEVHFLPLGEEGIDAPIAMAIREGVVRGGRAGVVQGPAGQMHIAIPTDENGVIELAGLPGDAQVLCGFQVRWDWIDPPLMISAEIDGSWRGELAVDSAGSVNVRGQVVTEQGQGIAGAYLRSELIPGLRAQDDGTFEVALNGDHESTWLIITAKSFATERTTLEVGSSGGKIQKFALRTERSLLVRTADAEGRAVPNVPVETKSQTPSSGIHFEKQGYTNDQGELATAGLFDGEIVVFVRANDVTYRAVARAGESEVTVPVESPGELQVQWASSPVTAADTLSAPVTLVLRRQDEADESRDWMSRGSPNVTHRKLTPEELTAGTAVLRWSPGEYRLLAFGENGLLAEQRVTIEPGQRHMVTLAREPNREPPNVASGK